ncbi:hypothetical protein CC1G_08385 [Coprinopsis cinerea okayama7|uniref:Uncharacterized protein n=1 Tax=Coprinopsis cinerea (strain Okayama-7 / 130 / ATCC MYA-4618 / FGSC 9003) TaxID=240176 RepID=A8NAL6_COPC7|nr:hypothetical protein CC1G_08385 [Coprinopsis cinerea okayama7\|eukprot:XP_001831868.2 hypothetical protein CC1G_08385 [Coprinopsis cinerea okayama7\
MSTIARTLWSLAYVVPKGTEKDHKQMTAIEYNLNYQHLTLNLDTSVAKSEH